MQYLIYFNFIGGLAQSEERNVSNVEAPGSKPGFSIYFDCIYKIIWNKNLASLA